MTVYQCFFDTIVFSDNCHSIKNKIDEFVMGTESWLNGDVTNSEVFVDNFVGCRKDGNNHGGGVFILVDQSVASSPIAILPKHVRQSGVK